MKNKKYGFIGQGFVGGNLADNYEERGYNVVRYDVERYKGNKEKIRACDVVFIAVPTPTVNEMFDSSILFDVVKLCRDGAVVVIKSTVPPEVLSKLSIEFNNLTVFHSPEFLDENTAKEDTDFPKKNIIGVKDKTNPDLVNLAVMVMNTLPSSNFSNVVSYKESAMIKYIHNAYFYVKNVFFNMSYDLCNEMGADWDEIIKAILSEPRIDEIHTRPIDKGGRGAGGHCLIKDFSVFSGMFRNFFIGEGEGDSRCDVITAIESMNNIYLNDSGKDLEILNEVYVWTKK